MNIDELIGKTCDFYGVDNYLFRIGIGAEEFTFEAVEDDCDGYRSMCDEVREALPAQSEAAIFFDAPVAQVVVCVEEGLDGYALKDATTGHVWLRMGTHEYDEYYPCFTFEYVPSGETVAATEAP